MTWSSLLAKLSARLSLKELLEYINPRESLALAQALNIDSTRNHLSRSVERVFSYRLLAPVTKMTAADACGRYLVR